MKKTERSKPSAGRTSRASYRRHPMSLVQRIAVTASAVITFAILVALLAYILIMGVPNLKPGLFAWHYTSDNCSMTPAIINTLLMVVLSLLLSVPFGIGITAECGQFGRTAERTGVHVVESEAAQPQPGGSGFAPECGTEGNVRKTVASAAWDVY